MEKRKNSNRISGFFKLLYVKLCRINDSPQKIALGLGLGVFSGIFPGTGALAAIFLAFCFRANRASALLGSLVTNTWLSLITFILSIKAGSILLAVRWQQVQQDWNYFLKGFHWLDLFRLSILKLILPVILGYLVIAFLLGLLAYLVTLIIILNLKHKPR